MPQSEPGQITVRLPGVGDRLDLRDTSGRRVQVVRRYSGHVEIHDDAAGASIELDPPTAHTLGAFVSGHYLLAPELAERVADVLGGLMFDWVHLPAGASAVGRTIEQLAVRRRTGVTIVAILRRSIPIVAPDPDARLEAGDDLVIACRAEDRDVFVQYVIHGR